MQATTSGVIHKNNVILKKDVTQLFLDKQKDIFTNLSDKTSVLYNKDTCVQDVSLNYLNVVPENTIEETLKNMILKEYYSCESLYPFLGDFLLHKIFEKKHQESLIKSFRNDMTSSIADWFFENTNLNRSINIEKYPGDELSVEVLDEFIFNIDYDFSFFNKISSKEIKSYRFALINGFIESVGEIHHLLSKANETKEPYVFFCFGVSEEVKQTIIKNNRMGRFRVFPVCLNVNDESSLNILNDLAAIHSSSVISSELGQTISQEMRKELPTGIKISFYNKTISIVPVANKKDIEKHRAFLRTRIKEAATKTDVRTDVLENRLKMFTGKRIIFYIPKNYLLNKSASREIDYYFRFMSNLSKKLRIVKLKNQKFYIPNDYINIAERKKQSLLKKFSDIQAIIY